MKEYLINFLNYNDWANRKLIEAIIQIPEKDEAVRLFSHRITTQDKWLNRITKLVDDSSMNWFGELLQLNDLQIRWSKSYSEWLALLEQQNEDSLNSKITFNRATDGKLMSVKLQDIILQINYHCIHHRAQINKLISKQNHPVPATDYILTVIQEA